LPTNIYAHSIKPAVSKITTTAVWHIMGQHHLNIRNTN